MLGEPARAWTHYEEALHILRKMRFRPEIALIQLEFADLVLEHYPVDKAVAISHLDAAIEGFCDMKMQPALERARQLRNHGIL
jgi:hypothetical protein